MSNLSFKTRMNTSVRGLPKVYFCCHPKDFDVFFEDISNEILSKQNCSVWYHDNATVDYNDEFFSDLLQMNLFVVPVTSRFLKKGNAVLENEFRFAQKHHIPILPLMQEQGLDKKFNELCGDIQYLDKFNNDGTCIQYSDKLENFLSSVLVGDELAEKIRCAFDDYVFLSYRKKDRYHAQELMKLIHKNEFCRDIAIWYDEFLVPGENFNSAISEALQKSDLFVLAVTPNLVNETNYVMNVEFPMAKESGKPILPCEMVNTDKALLTQKYENIPECADEESGSLTERLRYHFRDIATRTVNSSPEHLYFIGLAYLNGIDVEVDRERALGLITSAAEQGLPDAVRQLINMYANGDGVRFNRRKAFEWRKRLLQITSEDYEREKDYNSGYDYVRACFELANAYYELDQFEDCIKYSNELKNICALVEKEIVCLHAESFLLIWHCGLAELLLGQSYHAISDLESAEKHYKESKAQLLKFVMNYDDEDVYRDISILHNKMAQLYKVKAEYDEAIKHYESALCIQQKNLKEFGGSENLVVQLATFYNMSEVYRLIGDLGASKEKASTSLKLLDELIELYGIAKYVGLKINILLAVGDCYRIDGDLKKALEIYNEVGVLEKVFIDEYGEIPYASRAMRLARIAQVHFQLGDLESTIDYGERALEIFGNSDLVSEQYSATGGADYSTMCLFIGVAYFNGRNDPNTALQYLENSVYTSEERVKCGAFCNIPELVMAYCVCCDCYHYFGDTVNAGKYIEKAVQTYEEHLSQFKDFRTLSTAFNVYLVSGKSYISRERFDIALENFKKAESLYNEILKIVPGNEENLRCDYVLLCYLVACCYCDLEDEILTKKYFLKCFDEYSLMSEDRYVLANWDQLGIACYQLFNFSKGFIETRKWKKRLIDVARKMKSLYPDMYQESLLYQELGETEIFD